MNHSPRKRFGQNFLNNPLIINRIIEALNPQPADKMIEIGPGLGALTQPLLERVDQLTAIEIDRDLLAFLTKLPGANRLSLVSADALTIDYHQWNFPLRLVGNLPYNISTPLLFHLFNYLDVIKDMHFMLQKEVVERLAAHPGTKDYGRLSIMAQYRCQVESILDVPPESFYPKPKVNSAIVRLTPHRISPYPTVNIPSFERLVAQAFSMRRKTLANNLKSLITPSQLMELNIDPGKRPEQITIMEYTKIVGFINK